MAQPTTNTNGIVIDIPSNIATPSTGYVTYFFNSDDSNKMYYKQDDASIFPVTSTMLNFDPNCLCQQAAKTICAWDQALLDGTLTDTTYLSLVTAGIAFTGTNGTDTWTVKIGLPAA